MVEVVLTILLKNSVRRLKFCKNLMIFNEIFHHGIGGRYRIMLCRCVATILAVRQKDATRFEAMSQQKHSALVSVKPEFLPVESFRERSKPWAVSKSQLNLTKATNCRTFQRANDRDKRICVSTLFQNPIQIRKLTVLRNPNFCLNQKSYHCCYVYM